MEYIIEFATIKNIESSDYSFKKVDIVDIINNIQDSNIEKYYNKLEKNVKKQYYTEFNINDKKLYIVNK